MSSLVNLRSASLFSYLLLLSLALLFNMQLKFTRECCYYYYYILVLLHGRRERLNITNKNIVDIGKYSLLIIFAINRVKCLLLGIVYIGGSVG